MPATPASVLAAASTCAALAEGGVLARLPAPAPGLRLLSEEEAGVVRALAEALHPRADHAADVASALDGLLARGVDPVAVPVVRHLLRGFDRGPVATHGARFTQLEPPLRAEVVADWRAPAAGRQRLTIDLLAPFVAWAVAVAEPRQVHAA
ncbi:MAG: gluconate 2-dehydrogenase subunit 3 family protein [Myxococcota bacterium]